MAKVLQAVRTDEGSTSPYIARLWVGTSELRDTILPTAEARHEFDDRYKPVVTALDKARETAREIRELVAEHRRVISQRGAVELYSNGQIRVHIPVNDPLDRRFDSFTMFAHRAIAGVEIGFLFHTQRNFTQRREAFW